MGYEPAAGVRRLHAGTPPILSLSALDALVAVLEGGEWDRPAFHRRATVA